MSRFDTIRHMDDEQLLKFLLRFKSENGNCGRYAKKDSNCNPYTGKDCREGIKEYFKGEGGL